MKRSQSESNRGREKDKKDGKDGGRQEQTQAWLDRQTETGS